MTSPTGCHAWQEAVAADVLGELPEDRAAALARHLQTCSACRAARAALVSEETELRACFGLIHARGADVPLVAAAYQHGAKSHDKRSISMRPVWLVPVAAAAVLAFVIVSLWPGAHPGLPRAYAMSDLPELLQSEVVHVRGEMYVPPMAPPGQTRSKISVEYWLDASRGQWRQSNFSYSVNGSEMEVSLGEVIGDGEYVLTLDHTHKTAEFQKLNAYRRLLAVRRAIGTFFQQLFGGREGLRDFVSVGEEQNGSETYTVWELTAHEALMGMSYRVRCSLSPSTGQIGRLQGWFKSSAAGEWLELLSLDRWQRVAAAPAGTFATSVPPGYTPTNDRATAPLLSLAFEGGGSGNGISHQGYLSFRLPDGRVVLAWSSRDEEAPGSQAELFASLEFGGDLPKLPLEITGLRQRYGETDIRYVGRHLAYTRRADQFIEWSVYVPQQAAPAARWRTFYAVESRFHLPAGRNTPLLFANVSQPFWVDNAREFDELVRGGLAELSDDHVAPAEVTFDRVMQLAAQSPGTGR